MGLILDNEQTNDAKILYLTDLSTWGTDGIPDFATFQADIVSAYITIQYKTSNDDDWVVVSPNYDIASIIVAASTVADLIYPVTGTVVGLGEDAPLPDGIWAVGYYLTDSSTTYQFDTDLELLLDATIKSEVYKRVGTIAYQYYCNNNYYTKPIDDDLLLQSLYDAMVSSTYVAKKEEILKILEVLQRQTQ